MHAWLTLLAGSFEQTEHSRHAQRQPACKHASSGSFRKQLH
jgi:hypothetical protein